VREGFGADDCAHATSSHRATNGVGVVAAIRDHGLALCMFEKLFGDGRLVLLARRDLDVERAALRVDDGVELRGESTT